MNKHATKAAPTSRPIDPDTMAQRHSSDARTRTVPSRRKAAGVILVMHETLVLEIGTAREVVSRHLKALEAEGLLRTGRGRIEILDAAALEQRLSGAA